MAFRLAFKTAIGMSLISMVSMEVAMNLVDVLLTGGAIFEMVGDTFYAAGWVCDTITL